MYMHPESPNDSLYLCSGGFWLPKKGKVSHCKFWGLYDSSDFSNTEHCLSLLFLRSGTMEVRCCEGAPGLPATDLVELIIWLNISSHDLHSSKERGVMRERTDGRKLHVYKGRKPPQGAEKYQESWSHASLLPSSGDPAQNQSNSN